MATTYPAGQLLSAPVTNGTALAKFGTHIDYLGTGGYRTLQSLSLRDAIPVKNSIEYDGLGSGQRRVGMLVYVLETNSTYILLPANYLGMSDTDKLSSLADNSNWILTSSSGGTTSDPYAVRNITFSYSAGKLSYTGTSASGSVVTSGNVTITDIGDLTKLKTTAKGNLVDAINEISQSSGGNYARLDLENTFDLSQHVGSGLNKNTVTETGINLSNSISTGGLLFESNRLILFGTHVEVPTPTAPSDATNKQYVDGLIAAGGNGSYIYGFQEFTATADGVQTITLTNAASGLIEIRVQEPSGYVRPLYPVNYMLTTSTSVTVAADANILTGDKIMGTYYSGVGTSGGNSPSQEYVSVDSMQGGTGTITVTARSANTSKAIEYLHPNTGAWQTANVLTNVTPGTYTNIQVRLQASNPITSATFTGTVTVI